MNLLNNKRDRENIDFINYVCFDILKKEKTDASFSTEFAAVFVDGRDREINCLEDFACFHSFYTFSKFSYPIYVFINNTNNFLNGRVDLIKKYNIIINKIPPIVSHDEYSNFCIKNLYFLIPENIKHIITIQPDGMLMKKGYEEYILNKRFPYIGSPWLHSPSVDILNSNNQWIPYFKNTQVGNGGLSYRNTDFCREASKRFSQLTLRERFTENKTPPEDLFFSVIANHFFGTPSVNEARQFSIDPLDKDDYNNKVSFGFHYFSYINPWKGK